VPLPYNHLLVENRELFIPNPYVAVLDDKHLVNFFVQTIIDTSSQ